MMFGFLFHKPVIKVYYPNQNVENAGIMEMHSVRIIG